MIPTSDRRVLWFTGFSGSGKTTLARAFVKQYRNGIILDGDDLREGLNSDLGFSIEDRNENVRRVREMAKWLFAQGFTPIVTLISPIESERDKARALFPAHCFVEIHLTTSIEECERRDPKGLYKLKRDKMTGIGSPYEPPSNPDLTLDTSKVSLGDCVKEVWEAINPSHYQI